MEALIGISLLMALMSFSIKTLISPRDRQTFGIWIPLGGLAISLPAVGYVAFLVVKEFQK